MKINRKTTLTAKELRRKWFSVFNEADYTDEIRPELIFLACLSTLERIEAIGEEMLRKQKRKP